MTAAGIDIHSLHRHQFPDAMLAAFERVKHQDSAAARASQQQTATIGFSAQAEFSREDQQEIRQFAREFNQHHCFITSDINPLTRFGHWISLFRSDPDRPCTAQEIDLLAALAPHLMQALAINRLAHLDRLSGDVVRESWSVAIADPRGVLYHSDQGFRELVGIEWPLAAPDRMSGELMRRLFAGENRVAGVRVVVQGSPEHGLLFLKARRRHQVDSLSTREFVVASMLSSGLTQKQVAARLGRSPETIRSQARVVFDKLGINNVTVLGPLLALRQ
jgi:DNA-binding CsgD family transcriptional regulator